jgi:hypothetical protein
MYETMGALIGEPWLALVPAGLCLLLYMYSRRRFVLVTAAVWLGYCAYEYGMKLRLLCSGECNIRVDLLVLYPVLALLLVVSLFVAFAPSRKP